MAKRPSGFYPTDPKAVAALRRHIEAHYPWTLKDHWRDLCAGYGELLTGVCDAKERRHAVEIQPGFLPLLGEVVPADQIVIGSAFDDREVLVSEDMHDVLNPPFTTEVMRRFVALVLARRAQQRAEGQRPTLIAVLALTSFWHSRGAQELFKNAEFPTERIDLGFRICCDGSAPDQRTHMWLVWAPCAPMTRSARQVIGYLASAADGAVSQAVSARHKALAAQGEALFLGGRDE